MLERRTLLSSDNVLAIYFLPEEIGQVTERFMNWFDYSVNIILKDMSQAYSASSPPSLVVARMKCLFQFWHIRVSDALCIIAIVTNEP